MMSPEDFIVLSKAEQEKWINPVGRLILAAASIERSVNELLEILAPDDIEVWRMEEFSARADRISEISKRDLPDTLAKALKDQKRRYWPVMANRNAIAHNPLFIQAFGQGADVFVSATILHQRKNVSYDLTDIQKFADEADAVSADFTQFAANFSRTLQNEIDKAKILLSAMHLRLPKET